MLGHKSAALTLDTLEVRVGVAGFEPTASSSRTTTPARLNEATALVVVVIRRSARWQHWSTSNGIGTAADCLRTGHRKSDGEP
jgi:hypothetical protein